MQSRGVGCEQDVLRVGGGDQRGWIRLGAFGFEKSAEGSEHWLKNRKSERYLLMLWNSYLACNLAII